MQSSKETKFLLGLITFGLLATLFIEVSGIRHRPIILLIFIGISTTALMYQLLGGVSNSAFNTPVFKLSGSAAFLFAFIYFINPILERQTFPKKEALFSPSPDTWMAVSPDSLVPIDLEVNYYGYTFKSSEFAQFKTDKNLSINSQGDDLQVFFNANQKRQLGVLTKKDVKSKLNLKEATKIVKGNDVVFPKNVELNKVTPTLDWFPYQIKPVRFDSDHTSYEIVQKVKGEEILKAKGDIFLRGSKLHTIDNEQYLITIHRVVHLEPDTWARFAVAKLSIAE